MNPPCNRKSRTGNPSPTAGRARSLSQPSASFEARSAPRSYPTTADQRVHRGMSAAGGSRRSRAGWRVPRRSPGKVERLAAPSSRTHRRAPPAASGSVMRRWKPHLGHVRLLDHLVRRGQQRFRDGEAEGLGGLDIDDQFEFGRLQHRHSQPPSAPERLTAIRAQPKQSKRQPRRRQPPQWSSRLPV